MRTIEWKGVGAALVTGLLTLAALGASAQTDRKEIAGTFSATYTNHQPEDVGDIPGHALVLAQSKGFNRNTGPTAYMDGAQVTSSEIADLVQGTGKHQGYTQFTGEGSSVAVKWSGNVTTKLSPENQLLTNFSGKWEYMSGTGEYAGIKGNGTYEGRMTSPTEYTVDWKGFYSK